MWLKNEIEKPNVPNNEPLVRVDVVKVHLTQPVGKGGYRPYLKSNSLGEGGSQCRSHWDDSAVPQRKAGLNIETLPAVYMVPFNFRIRKIEPFHPEGQRTVVHTIRVSSHTDNKGPIMMPLLVAHKTYDHSIDKINAVPKQPMQTLHIPAFNRAMRGIQVAMQPQKIHFIPTVERVNNIHVIRSDPEWRLTISLDVHV
jgi:hypothetical protein